MSEGFAGFGQCCVQGGKRKAPLDCDGQMQAVGGPKRQILTITKACSSMLMLRVNCHNRKRLSHQSLECGHRHLTLRMVDLPRSQLQG